MPDTTADGLNFANPADNKQLEEELDEQEAGRQLMFAAELIKRAQKKDDENKTLTTSSGQLTAPTPLTNLPPGIQDALRLHEIANQAHDNLFESKPLRTILGEKYTITIDRQKLTVSHWSLFKTRRTTSVQNRDLINVEASMGPFYGSLVITSKHFLNNVQTAKFMRRQDVLRARRLLQGLIIAFNAKVDITNIESTQLIELLMDLGRENRSKK
jgi:hypothetical protein